MIPREQLERWRELADAATPGPWFLQETPGSYPYIARWVVHKGEKLRSEVDEDADLAFAAAAREAVPALIAEVEAQARENERLRAALTHIAAGGCPSPEPCATHGKGALWCDACVAGAALKETP